MATFLSLTPSRFLLIPRRPSSSPSPSSPPPFLARPLHKSALLSSSSFLSATYLIVTEEEEQEAAAAAEEEGSIEARVQGIEDPDFRFFQGDARPVEERKLRRVAMARDGFRVGSRLSLPGFGWWPIKAFRPCPGFVASGGRYRRKGQSMDEVAFGRGEREMPSENIVKSSSRKKKQGSKRLN